MSYGKPSSTRLASSSAFNHARAVSFDELAKERLARAVGVNVSSVNEIAADSRKALYTFCASSLGAPQPQSSPKVMVPRANSDTRNPDLPRSRYFIVTFDVFLDFGAVRPP